MSKNVSLEKAMDSVEDRPSRRCGLGEVDRKCELRCERALPVQVVANGVGADFVRCDGEGTIGVLPPPQIELPPQRGDSELIAGKVERV